MLKWFQTKKRISDLEVEMKRIGDSLGYVRTYIENCPSLPENYWRNPDSYYKNPEELGKLGFVYKGSFNKLELWLKTKPAKKSNKPKTKKRKR